MNKKMSGIISLAVFSLYAHNAAATYTPTSDFATYTTEQISENVYNTALSQNAQAPVFKYIDSTGATGYYKWIMPDLSVYKNKDGKQVYVLEEPYRAKDTVDFFVIDTTGNVSETQYYLNNIYAQGEPNSVAGGTINGNYMGIGNGEAALTGYAESITGNFIANGAMTTSNNLYNDTGAAIHIINNTGTIKGDFLNNSITGYKGNGGAIDMAGPEFTVDSISGNFIQNKAINGGALYNNGIIGNLNGSFIKNTTTSSSWGYSSAGGAIYNSGTIKNVNSDFIENMGKGGAIYNYQDGIIESLYGNFIGNKSNTVYQSGAIWNEGIITVDATNKEPMIFATNSDTILNEGVLNFAGGTIYLQSIYDNESNATGTMNITGADVVVAEGATLTQKSININSGSLSTSASVLKSNISNNDSGTIRLLGGIIDVDITGSGTTVIDGNVSSNKYVTQDTTITNNGKLNISGTKLSADIVNNGVLEITSGSLSAQYDITGTGVTNIAGNVTSSRNILQNINVLDGYKLTIKDASIKSDIFGTGTTYIAGTVEALASLNTKTIINSGAILNTSASHISGAMTNNGKLYLSSGTLNTAIFGEGYTHIIGTVSNATEWTGKTLCIEEAGHFISNAGNIGNRLLNYGTLTLNGGDLNVGVDGTGTTIIDGSVRAETNNAISNNMQVKQDSMLAANATILNGANIENQGTLRLTSGQLSSVVSGAGTTEISGNVSATAKINQDIIIEKAAGLYISASNIGSDVYNAGILNLNAGTLHQDISGIGQTLILGNVHNNATINQTIVINSASDTLTTAFDKLAGDITNRGNLVLTSGAIDKYIGGNGTISIAGNVTNTAYIDHKVDVYSNGTLTSDADKFRKIINNNGNLYLQSGTLSANITGSTGNLYIQGDVTTNAAITHSGIVVMNGGTLNATASLLGMNYTTIMNYGTMNLHTGTLTKHIYGTGTTNILGDVSIYRYSPKLENLHITDTGSLNLQDYWLTTNDLTIDGTLVLKLNSISSNSSDYAGGKVVVDGNLTYGDNSKLQVLVGSGLSQRQHTGELELIAVAGQTSGSFSEIVANNLYSVEQRNGKYIISYGPTINNVVEMGGGNDNNKATANAWDRIENPTGLIKELQSVLNYLLQYDEENYVKGLDNLAPSDSNFVAGIARTTNTTMAQQIAKRLSDVRGRSGGDVTFKDMSVWAQGLYNMAEQDGDAAFDSKTFGVMAGIDGNITDNLTVGVGYAYNKTDATANERDIKAKGSNISLYGEYVYDFTNNLKQEKGLDGVYKNKQYLEGVYINAAISYGSTDYEEESEMGNFADYTVSSIGANANMGLVLSGTKFVPEFGVRYLHINEYDYQDAAEQEINVDAADILTLVAKAKYSSSFDVNMLTSEQNTRSLSLKPFGHIGVSYDVLNSDNVANVSISNVQYQIKGESIDPLGVSAGLGIETSFWGFDWQFGYDLEWHSNFTSHTGKIRAKYVF